MLFVQTCTEYFQVLGDAISLSPLQEFALSVKCLLKFYGIISLSNFEILFHEYYGIEVRPALYNFLNACSMLQSISNVAVIKGEVNKYICLVEDRNGKCVNFFFFFLNYLLIAQNLSVDKFDIQCQEELVAYFLLSGQLFRLILSQEDHW